MKQPLLILLVSVGFAATLLLSISYGSVSIPFAAVVELLFNPDGTTWSRILWELRLPRALFAFIGYSNEAAVRVSVS